MVDVDRIVALVEQLKIEPKSCLDIGCGRGLLLKHLEVYNFARILGLKYDTETPEIDDVVYSKDEVRGKFDLITCIHMPNPDIEWMLSKLNEGGTLLLETKEELELTLDLPVLYLDTGTILIGNRYANSTSQKVYYSYDSPDFDTKKEYLQWLKQSY